VDGLRIVPGYLDRAAQAAMREVLQDVIARAPLYTPRMPKTGKPMSVRMSNCGPLGWVTDERGYRYEATHPETGAPWPAMPSCWVAPRGLPFMGSTASCRAHRRCCRKEAASISPCGV
jgi:alkylated DNA repair dioxygenase AlkB